MMRQLLCISITLAVLVAACKKDNKESTPSVTTTAVTSITSSSASTGGAISGNGGSSISTSGVTYAIHNNPTVSDSLVVSNVSSGAFTSNLSNLHANTTYYVRAYAINGSGTGYGDVDSFTTLKGVPTVLTTAITNNQALMATSGGNITNDGGSLVTARGLVWSTSPHPTTADSKLLDSSAGTGLYVDTISDLSLTTYYVRAFATNSYGTGYGNEITFTVSTTGTVTDIDGNAYGTVVIGTQTWFSSNLKTRKFQNGDQLVDGSAVDFDWSGVDSNVSAYTYPNDSAGNNNMYGKYYNTAAINDARNICPAGWHIPTLGDWQKLEFYLGESASDTSQENGFAGNIGDNLLEGGSSGLNLQEAGFMTTTTPGQPATYYPVGTGNYGSYWTTTTNSPWGSSNYNGNYNLVFNFNGSGPIFTFYDPNLAASVRCIKN